MPTTTFTPAGEGLAGRETSVDTTEQPMSDDSDRPIMEVEFGEDSGVDTPSDVQLPEGTDNVDTSVPGMKQPPAGYSSWSEYNQAVNGGGNQSGGGGSTNRIEYAPKYDVSAERDADAIIKEVRKQQEDDLNAFREELRRSASSGY